jgi:hypothetical protein
VARLQKVRHRFVEHVPGQLEDGIVYVSIEYGTAVHKCCCGCGEEVVTPLSPVDWKLIFDGETISLFPSVGNWSLACKSHYWIREDRVHWARKWSREEIMAGREADRSRKEAYFTEKTRGDGYQGSDWHLMVRALHPLDDATKPDDHDDD